MPCVYVPELLAGVQTPALTPKVPVAEVVPPPPVPLLDKFIFEENNPLDNVLVVPAES
jgi:hypothetical protein